MTESEKQRTLSELKDFYKKLKSYNRYVRSEEQLSQVQIRYRDSLREKLVRQSGALKDKIIELTGAEHFVHRQTKYSIWSEAFNLASWEQTTALGFCINATNEAIGKLESTPIAELEVQEVSAAQSPKAFIAHEGETKSLDKLKAFLDALGVTYLIAEIEPSDGRLVEPQVDGTQEQADFAIIFATKGKVINKMTGKPQMGTNVADELGRARKVFGNKMILLLQKGVESHSNVSGIVHERFTPQSMDKAFTKVVKELRKWCFLKVEKPEEQKLETI